MRAAKAMERWGMLDGVRFDGKTVLVTGAASGLARATALRLAGLGADLCLVDLDAEGLAATADQVRTLGRAVEPVAADLSRPEACPRAVEAAIGRFGRLDALCNVAGVIRFSPFAKLPLESLQRTLAVNFQAPFLLCQAAIPHLLNSRGAIVNVASSAAFIGEAYVSDYAASKAALVSLTKSLAMEYARTELRISAVAPGGMPTGMGAGVDLSSADYDMAIMQRYMGLRGLVAVEDVAAMIALLASDRSAPFHGGCVRMDAGITAG
jgi:NAD(P)-dependent dehydrogenase (short-subunit alcohol dehydrogenase family)